MIFAAIACILALEETGPSLLKQMLLSAATVAVLSNVAGAAEACEGLRPGPRGLVTEVVDGDTVMLDSGLQIRMIGIQAPKLPLGREGFETWPLADEARAALEAIALGHEVELRYAGAERDRHGRALGHLIVLGEDTIWAQEVLLRTGLARVYSFADNRFCLDELYAAESRARADGLGIWSDSYYVVRPADDPARLLELVDRYELVEGRVLNADRAGSRVYLNFGRYWKEDFTVVIETAGRRVFEQAGIDPLDLEGALVRVRGWVEAHDGPRMEVTHPEQIEVILRP
jgi:endonuclease YncB( thermonuclease family)